MSENEDVLTGFHYEFKVGELLTGYFLELTGVDDESEVIDHKAMTSGARESLTHKIPGRTTGGATLTLKRGITSNQDFWAWRQMVVDGNIAGARQNGSVLVYGQDGSLMAQWDFSKAWPAKVDGPTFTSDANTYGVEELTIVTESFGRVL